MSDKLEKALHRLRSILPLKESQEKCNASVKRLHQQVLRSFVSRGRILTREEMALHVGDLDEAVNLLRTSDMVTFSESGEPVGAYPFTTNEREHRVRVNGHAIYSMCALDALAIAPMFGEKTQILSQCRVTGEPIEIGMTEATIQNPDQVFDIQLGIAWGAADEESSCADSLCMEMIFLRDRKTALEWLAVSPEDREIFTLPQAVEFASCFFVPLLA